MEAGKPQTALGDVECNGSRAEPLVEPCEASRQGTPWLGAAWGGVMLLSGTLCTVSAKMVFDTQAEGLTQCGGSTYCNFNKPWFMVFLMKCSMSACILVHFATRNVNEPSASTRTLLKISLPSFLDLLNVLLSNIGLLWVSASIFQMTRGSVVVFSAILSVQLLKRRLLAFQYWAVGCVTAAVILVGIAGVLASGQGSSTVAQIIIGLLLILISQIVLAYQIVVEERMMTEAGVTPFQLAAYEGLWGLLFFLVLIPVLSLTPGNPNPDQKPSPMLPIYHEDFQDSLVKLRNSGQLVALCLLYLVVIAVYNVSGQAVTKHLSAVLRSILEACRTLGVWIADLLLFYAFQRPNDGEAWTVWSWIELAGFLLLVYGTMAYKGLLPIPCAPRPLEAVADGIPRACSAPSAASSFLA